MTKVDFSERELADMENAIKHVYQRILECNLNNAGQKKKSKKGEFLIFEYYLSPLTALFHSCQGTNLT